MLDLKSHLFKKINGLEWKKANNIWKHIFWTRDNFKSKNSSKPIFYINWNILAATKYGSNIFLIHIAWMFAYSSQDS